MKKHIKVCDICEKAIAGKTCLICKKDLCDDCGRDLQLKLAVEEGSAKELSSPWVTCKECSLTIQQIEFKNKDFNKQMQDLVKPFLVKNMILNHLEDKKPEPESTLVASSGTFAVSGTSTWTTPVATAIGSVIGIATTGAKKGKIVSVKLK